MNILSKLQETKQVCNTFHAPTSVGITCKLLMQNCSHSQSSCTQKTMDLEPIKQYVLYRLFLGSSTANWLCTQSQSLDCHQELQVMKAFYDSFQLTTTKAQCIHCLLRSLAFHCSEKEKHLALAQPWCQPRNRKQSQEQHLKCHLWSLFTSSLKGFWRQGCLGLTGYSQNRALAANRSAQQWYHSNRLLAPILFLSPLGKMSCFQMQG